MFYRLQGSHFPRTDIPGSHTHNVYGIWEYLQLLKSSVGLWVSLFSRKRAHSFISFSKEPLIQRLIVWCVWTILFPMFLLLIIFTLFQILLEIYCIECLLWNRCLGIPLWTRQRFSLCSPLLILCDPFPETKLRPHLLQKWVLSYALYFWYLLSLPFTVKTCIHMPSFPL